ncbi:MAG: hypothetical protein COS14_03865, partial [Bacteroidetes bacterium CG02_land_8_20_14_3_00_31_25]
MPQYVLLLGHSVIVCEDTNNGRLADTNNGRILNPEASGRMMKSGKYTRQTAWSGQTGTWYIRGV